MRLFNFFSLILILCHLLFFSSGVFSEEDEFICEEKTLNGSENQQPNLKIAICYWGLTRSTKEIYKSHFKHLFNILEANHIAYDVFMHTWYLKGKQRVWNTELDIEVDYHEYALLNPSYYRIDDQDLFTDALEFDKYFDVRVWTAKGDDRNGEWPPLLILNHLCALESLKRVTDMVLESNNHYDLIMYIRPDALLINQFPITTLNEVKQGDILIPDFFQGEGYNDRFAVLNAKTAPIYGKRIDEIIDYRKIHGRIVSEKYVKFICDEYNLNVIFIRFTFRLVRPKL